MKQRTFVALMTFFIAVIIFSGYTLFKRYGPKPPPEAGPNYVELPTDPRFAASPTVGKQFEATIELTPLDNEADRLSGSIQYDGGETMRFAAKQGDTFVEFYVQSDNVILCEAEECYRSKFSDIQDPLFDIYSYVYRREDLKELGQGLQLVDEITCGDATCDVWQSNAVIDGGALNEVILEQGTGNIIHTDGIIENSRMVLDYVYKDVKIILPLNITDAPPILNNKPSL